MNTIPNGHQQDWTPTLTVMISNGHYSELLDLEWTRSQIETISNGICPEWTRFQIYAITNGHNPEWTPSPSRMDTVPNVHHSEWTPSRMD